MPYEKGGHLPRGLPPEGSAQPSSALPLVGFALPLVAEGSATNGSAQLTEGNARPTPQSSGRHLNFQCSQLQRRKIQNKI
ncbi:MAG TPA: hypothetical protein VGO51_17495, partial [Burkholderiaceae bacterium]|nr:hypothetical protein [Burkholderiaceae bacterium]